MNSKFTGYRCSICNTGYAPDEVTYTCPKDGGNLDVLLDYEALKRMGREDLTVHGFRSTFRDWAAEQTDTPHHVCEQALGHAISNAVEKAYRRGDLFTKRSELMEAWSHYCRPR